MEVKLALVADAANVSSEGKLNILGAFDVIYANKLPARHPEMVLVLNLEASPAEAGRTKTLEIKMLTEDGKPVSSMSAEFQVPSTDSGRRIRMQSIFRLIDTPFPREGMYEITILINEQPMREIPLELVLKDGDEDGD